jgi:serine/threonine protein kinase
MSTASSCTSPSSVRRAATATSTSNSNDAALPAARHHLPPPLNGLIFLQHTRSALSHDSFLAEVDSTAGAAEAVVMRRGSGSPASREATKRVRVYALDYLQRDEECRFGLERECMAGRIIGSHPHLLTVERVFASATDLFLVEPYCSGGDLYEYMVGVAQAAEAAAAAAATATSDSHVDEDAVMSSKGLSVALVRRLARELLMSVAYLHNTCGLAHRNIKLEVLFLDAAMQLRVGGFGLCAVLPTSSASPSGDGGEGEGEGGQAASPGLLRLCCGSKHYAAPELIQGQPYHGELVDAWACGVVLFALLTGCFPFDSAGDDSGNDGDDKDKDVALFDMICHRAEAHLAQHPALAVIDDPLAVDLLRNLLRANPQVRYTVTEALEHPFVA